MRCTRGSTDGKPSEPRRSKRQRIDLTSEEGFDRHELERALRQSLEEERLKEKQKPLKKQFRTKAEKSLKINPAPARSTPKKRKAEKVVSRENKVPQKVRAREKETGEAAPAGQALVENEPSAKKFVKKSAQKVGEVTAIQSNIEERKPPGRQKPKFSATKKRESAKDKSKAEVVVEEDNEKEAPGKQLPDTTDITGASSITTNSKEEKEQLAETVIEPQKDKEEQEVRRLPPPYRIPSRASDLITLLACAKEVLGDHEYSSDQE